MTVDLVGTKIQNYRILRLVGEGGMGKVYEAVHEQIDRRAAIKVLHAEYARDPEMAKRFFNEARAVNIIGHPGLVSIYELGKLDDGAAYIIMEFLEGESLRRRIERHGGRLGQETLRIARQIAAALHAAHTKNIVHRDLKPDNIIIVADSEVPGGERAKILDFGIAKLLKGSPADGQAKTRSGSVLGTPLYLAPEQCGSQHPVSDKTDVYSLGVMMFEMLAGRPPFIGEEPTQLIGQHLFAEPPPLPLPAGIPSAVGPLVRRMLAKDPQQRPTMKDIATTLGRLAPSTSDSAESEALQEALPASENVTIPFHLLRSTLGMATGQRRQRRVVSAFVGVTLLIGAVIGGFQFFRKTAHERPSPISEPRAVTQPQTPLPEKIRWSIESVPPKAQVIRHSDGQVLGQTPWQSEQEAANGNESVVLHLDGYVDVTLRLDRAQSVDRIEKFVPISRSTPTKPAPTIKNNPRPQVKPNAPAPPTRKVLSNENVKIIE